MLELTTATIGQISTLADKTIKVVLHLREHSPEQVAALMTYHLSGQEGVAIPITTEKKEGTSKSKRLRNVLYLYYDKCTSHSIPFEEYYSEQMEKFIQTIKQKLPDNRYEEY